MNSGTYIAAFDYVLGKGCWVCVAVSDICWLIGLSASWAGLFLRSIRNGMSVPRAGVRIREKGWSSARDHLKLLLYIARLNDGLSSKALGSPYVFLVSKLSLLRLRPPKSRSAKPYRKYPCRKYFAASFCGISAKFRSKAQLKGIIGSPP
ncbi:hypothetical protein L2E82_30447 [Cichorium intybus]|uniref:Uncharacterized protein n=1 Tax=Cichorium intybus TaxID=13427 RepID=A0ACB9D0R2_CICIN|nr:hypothetical protein L2E82_30447 [Cichorium intybus]